MKEQFADRLLRGVEDKKAPVCVGLDPVVERLPAELLKKSGVGVRADRSLDPNTTPDAVAQALLAFGTEVIQRTAPHVPVLKINVAFFEPHYAKGMEAYFELIRRAHHAGLLVIGDVKRGDVGHSCEQYALAHLGGGPNTDVHKVETADAVTVHPYLGFDGVEPFLRSAQRAGKGVFVLVQTSNPSALDVQGIRGERGLTLAEELAQRVRDWSRAEGRIGRCGYSCLGAVVAPQEPVLTRRLRELMPECIFLVPGYGAQGRSADEVNACFKPDGTGALINASRTVIFAYEDVGYRDRFGDDWRRCIEEAARDLAATFRYGSH